MINRFIYIITFSILFQLFVEVNSQISQTTISQPDLREAHTATFIDKKLYILGGNIVGKKSSPPKEEFLYIDFSTPFNTDRLNWTVPNDNAIPPQHHFAAAIKGGLKNKILFLYGGESLSGENMSLVYTFDVTSNVWSIPLTYSINPPTRLFITPVIDSGGLIYLYSGFNGTSSDILILDSINLSFSQSNPTNVPGPPGPGIEYGAVLLPDNNIIIYMGGIGIPLETVYLYNITTDIWTNRTTGGLIPSPRSSFSSVLGLNGRKVIIFGGRGLENGSITPNESLYVLDLNNFNWSIPTTTGKSPSNRVSHKSVLIGKYMVVTFGDGYLQEGENDVLLLDISNDDGYVWTTNFAGLNITKATMPSASTTMDTDNNNPPASSSSSSSNPLVISLVVVSSIFAISLIISFIYIRKIKSIFSSIKSIPILRKRPDRPTPQHNDQTNNFNFDNRKLSVEH